MGAMQNNPKEKKTSGNRRGSVKNSDRLAAFAKGRSNGEADWGGCDPALIQTILVSITGFGGAATFGLSRDEGAHMLTLLLDDRRETLWFNGDVDLDEELRAVIEKLEQVE